MPRRWPLGLYRVAGDSMQPGYRPGELMLGLRWFRPRVGQVVVAEQAGRPLLKRIVRLDTAGVWLEGDNPDHSTDSRHFGPLPQTQLEARIITKLS